MKSYFIEAAHEGLEAVLSELLPGQARPWLILDASDDPIAYLNVEADDNGTFTLQADVSGRHFYEDEKVLALLRSVRARTGGTISDDHDRSYD